MLIKQDPSIKSEDIDHLGTKNVDTYSEGFRKNFQEKFNTENLLGVTFDGTDEEDRFK